MIFMRKEDILSNENIELFTNEMTKQYLVQAGKRAGNKDKFSLMVQEIMLRFRDLYGTETPCTIIGKKQFGKITFQLKQKGPNLNPTAVEEEDFSFDILVGLGVIPKYTYDSRSGINCVTVNGELKPAKNGMLRNIVCAILLAVLVTILFKYLPSGVTNVIKDSFLAPVFSKIIALFAELATPLVFFAVVTGITGIGNQNTMNKIGKSILKGMLCTYLFAGCVFTIFAVVAYSVQSSGGGNLGFLKQLVEIVMDIIPDNLIEGFATDNDLQVITIAIFVGLVMLALGEKVNSVNRLCMECGEIVNRMMQIVCKCLPVVVFLGVVNLLSNDFSKLVSIYKFFLLFAGSAVVLILFMLVRVKVHLKVPISVVFRKQLPTLMINLTTSSQVAALSENLKCCKKKFGIDEKMVDFGVPLGVVVYMPCGAICLGLMTWAMAVLSGTPVAIEGVIKIFLVAIIVAIAAPPIPGSAIAVLPVMMSSCGIPGEAFSMGVIMATFMGYFLPAINGYCMQLELLLAADKIGMVDKKQLEKSES